MKTKDINSFLFVQYPYMKNKFKFLLDTGWVLLGSFTILFFQFLRKPIMAHYLGAEGLGLFSMTSMIVATTEMIIALGIPVALVKFVAEYKEDPEEINSYMSSGMLMLSSLGFVAFIVLFTLSEYFADAFNMPDLAIYIKIYSVVFPFTMAYTIFITYFNGIREMKLYTLIDTIKNGGSFVFVVILLYMGFEVKGAIYGSVLAGLTGFLIAWYYFRTKITLHYKNLQSRAGTLISFGYKLMLSNVINKINYQVDILMVGFFLTSASVGYYSAAISFSQVFWIFPASIQKISYPSASEYWAKKNLNAINKMIQNTMKYSAILLSFFGIVIWIYSDDIILILYGQAFMPAAIPLKILLIGTVIYGTFKSIGSTLTASGKPELIFKINTYGTIINIILNIILIKYYNITGAAIATSITLILITFFNIYYIKKIMQTNFDLKWYSGILTLSILSIVVHSLAPISINENVLGIFIIIAQAFILIIYFLNQDDRKEIKLLLKKLLNRITNT